MEERLLPLNDETEFQNVPNTTQNQFVVQNNLPSQNLFSSSHLNTIRNIDSDCNKNRNLDIGSDVVVIKSETCTDSNQPSDKISTKFTMTEEVETPLYPKVETTEPTVVSKKITPPNKLHNSIINSQRRSSSMIFDDVIHHNDSANNQINIAQSNPLPPDGGMQAWLVVLCSFLCNGIIFGIINSFGTVFVALEKKLKADNPDEEVAGMLASLVGSAAVGATFLLSPVSAILTDKYGIRKTSFIGSVIATFGMLLSALCLEYASGYEVQILIITYGILFGGGSSLVYTPSLVILGHYFRRHIGIVNGLAAAGSSIFTIVMPHILKRLLKDVGIPWTFGVLTGLVCILMLASLSFKSILLKEKTQEEKNTRKLDFSQSCAQFWSKIVYFDNWKNKQYVIWALAVPSALFGYFVPYFHLVAYVKSINEAQFNNTINGNITIGDIDGGSITAGVDDSIEEDSGYSGEFLVTCMAATSLVGRIVFGKIADHSKVNPVFLQQISFVSTGICTMLLTASPLLGVAAYPSMVILSLLLGLFDGCFITMFGPIAYGICGPSGASQGIGFILGMCGIPLTTGPPIAGLLKDKLGNYTVAFICAGIPPLIGALLMCFIYRVKTPGDSKNDATIEENNTQGKTVNTPIIKVYTPNGHSSTMSCENATGNSKLYPNIDSDTTDKDTENSENNSLMKNC